MNTILGSVGSKKLMTSGAVIAIIIQDGMSRAGGWLWWHGISIAIVTGCYCLAAAYQDKGAADNEAESNLVNGKEPPKP